MADVTFVQQAYDEDTGPDCVATLAAPVSANGCVVLGVCLAEYGVQLPIGGASGVGNTLFDDQGNVYTLAYDPAFTLNVASKTLYYIKAGINNAPSVFTIKDSNFRFTIEWVAEFANVDPANPIDHAGSFTTRSTTDASPVHSFAASAGSMGIAMVNWNDFGTQVTVSAASGWTARGVPGSINTFGFATAPFSTGGTKTLNMTLASAEDWEASAISLKSASPLPQFYPMSGGDLYF